MWMFAFLTVAAAVTFNFSSVSSEGWSVNYEKGKCNSESDPSGDVALICSESPTVKNLDVQLVSYRLVERIVSASIFVVNRNLYPVLVQTILVDATNAEEDVISFCSIDVEEALYPGDGFEYEINCYFPEMAIDVDQEIVGFSIRATPWE